jgi:hypothetical protein
MYPAVDVLAAEEGTTWPEARDHPRDHLRRPPPDRRGRGNVLESRKSRIAVQQDEDLRQLVRRYEQLAEGTLDAQQRAAADVSELRSRTSAIEQILRTVE